MFPMRAALILHFLLLVFLAACRDAPGPNAVGTAPAVTQTEQVTITLAVEDSSLNRYRPLVEAFEQENPNIRVRLVTIGDVADPDESGIRALATSFDVFPYSPNRQGENQYLLDLRPLLDLDSQFDTADFLPGLLPAPLEPLWAIPTSAAYYLTFYDQSAFAAAGLPPPDLDWTADDFLAATLALTVREGNEVRRWGYVPGQLRYSPLLASRLTGPLTTPDGNLRLADPDVVAAVQWLSDLFAVHEVSPWLEEYKPVERRSGSGGQSAQALITSGQAAMWHFTHLLFEAADENVGVTAVPHGPHGLAAEPILSGFAASRGTAHPEAAWQLLHFLSRQPPQDAGFLTVDPVPARRSVAAANSYWEQLPENLAPALQYTAENNTPPRISFQAANLLQEAITLHIDDGLPAAVALGQLPPPTAAPPETEAEVILVPTALPEADAAKIRITFNTPYVDSLRPLADRFSRDNPHISINVVERNAYASSVLDRTRGSDCFIGWSTDMNDEAYRAALLPLDPLLELDNDLQIGHFYPSLAAHYVHDGQVLGIPAWIRAPYLDYNRQIFEEANISPPPADWTLHDFLEIAQQLTTGEGETKQYAYAEYFVPMQLGFLEAFGVDWVDNSQGIPDLDFQAASEMIAWHVNTVLLHEIQPLITRPITTNLVAQSQQFDALIRAGQVAIWPGGDTEYIFAYAPRTFEVGRLSLPVGPSGYRVNAASGGYHIRADSPHPQVCWEWIKFLSTQAAAARAVWPSVWQLLAHIETAESEAFVTQAGPTMTTILQNFAHTPTGPITIRDWPSGWLRPGADLLKDAYMEAASGAVTVTEALTNAEAKFSQYRQCVIDEEAYENYPVWRSCILAVDPLYARRYAVPSD
jgi:ABC-type glycerol-3-phosphate transport system substrate-binding protein